MIQLAKRIGDEELGKKRSEVNSGRDLISFKIPEEKLSELVDKVKYFENRKIKRE